MFSSIVLSQKSKILDENNEVSLVNLSSRVITSILGINASNFTTVKSGEEARPDLISLREYGTDDHQDEICKMNGISNPYSLDLGDALVIPNLIDFSINTLTEADEVPDSGKPSDFRLLFRDIVESKNQNDVQKFNDAFDKSLAELQMNGSGLPPTVADFGDKQFLVKGGRVIFAPNIGTCVTNDNQPISKGELISKLIKNRLLG